jgi:hypothetical protein
MDKSPYKKQKKISSCSPNGGLPYGDTAGRGLETEPNKIF